MMFDVTWNPAPIALVGADYEEFKPETMKGYFVAVGNVTYPDRYQTIEEAVQEAARLAQRVLFLSSVDHYCMDAEKRGST